VQKSSSAGRQNLPSRTALSNEFPRTRFSGPKSSSSFTLLGGVLYTLYTSGRPDFLLESASLESRRPLSLNDLQTQQLKPSRQIRSISTRKKV
jgi:hypothetical protein